MTSTGGIIHLLILKPSVAFREICCEMFFSQCGEWNNPSKEFSTFKTYPTGSYYIKWFMNAPDT